jgi:lipid A 3-O-deacylase
MKTTMNLRLSIAGLLAAGVPLAHALDFKPDGVSLQAASGAHGTAMAGVGLIWDWDFERMRRKAELTAHTEVMLNQWRADAVGGGNQHLTQVVVLPSLRMRLARGTSPWFLEIGVGASWMDRRFITPDKEFSTQWNFYDVLGVGHTFGGVDGKHELGARWVHVSNAGIKKPNPGQDFLQLRYVARF